AGRGHRAARRSGPRRLPAPDRRPGPDRVPVPGRPGGRAGRPQPARHPRRPARRGHGARRGQHPPPEDRVTTAHPELVAHLLAHSVKRGDFVLKSGARSSWFIDSKQTTCRPDGMLLVAEAALAVLPPETTAVGGLTMGADAMAFAIAAIAA